MPAVADSVLVWYLSFAHCYVNQRISFIQKIVVTTIDVPTNALDVFNRQILHHLNGTVLLEVSFNLLVGNGLQLNIRLVASRAIVAASGVFQIQRTDAGAEWTGGREQLG